MTESSSTFQFYHYDPSIAAAVIFILLFLSATGLHLYQLLRTRTWFLIPLLIGGCFEWIGYVGRAISHSQTPNWTLGPYIVQTLLLLVAPALFAASIYMELGRIILLVNGEAHALIQKKWLTKVFVCGDVLSFLIQGAGGGIQSSGTATSLRTGTHIIIAGLFIQLLFFGFFILVAIRFDIKMSQSPAAKSQIYPWRKHLATMYASSFLIMVRSIFRVVEYLQGFNGYILKHEAFLYIFDASLMLLVMVIFVVIHPSEVNALLKGGHAASGRFGLKMTFVNSSHRILSGA